MIYLVVSILLNAFVGVIFKHFDKWNVNAFSAIVLNYWICVITGCIFLGDFPISTDTLKSDWFPWAILIGFLFITLFNVIAISSVKVGVTLTQAANKLSLAIPVVASILLYDEDLSLLKGAGILCAIIAVVLISIRDKKLVIEARYLLLPIILFLGSGIIDTVLKFVEQAYITSAFLANQWLISLFLIAALLGSCALIVKKIAGRLTLGLKEFKAAIFLGIPNYFSIFFLVKALQYEGLTSSAIIPINNIGILALVTLYGLFIFREVLSKKNILGLILAALAILFIYFGDL